MIQVHNLGYVYRSLLFPEHQALRDVTFQVRRGELIALLGASGSGKTTLIQHLNGLFLPTSGSVRIDGRNLSDPKTDLNLIRKKVGLVFQFPESQLFEDTVYRDVAFGLKTFGFSPETERKRVRSALHLVGLDPKRFESCIPFHLSGGEKRRAAIAGILVMEPDVLILDEPTAGLDWTGTGQVEAILNAYHRSGKTVIIVSHDMDLVARLAERVLVLSGGKLIYDGGKRKLFQQNRLLKQAGLSQPQVMQYMKKLRRRGLPVSTSIYAIDEAKREIRKALRENPEFKKKV